MLFFNDGNILYLPERLNDKLENVRRGIRIGMKMAARDIVERARDNHRYTSRTGMLTRSIQVKDREPIYNGGDWKIRVWLNPQMTATKSQSSYGVFQHEGTGQRTGGYIYPTNANALHFYINGREYFRRRVRGIPPDQFLYRAGMDLRVQIKNRLERGITQNVDQ